MGTYNNSKHSSHRHHFGRIHTPLHAFLALPAEQRSMVVWNTQISMLTKYIERAKEHEQRTGTALVTRDMPLADPFYNHAWLAAYDALSGHPYEKRLHALLAQWWGLERHVAFDVVNQGVIKRINRNPELFETAFNRLEPARKEALFLKLVKRQKYLPPVGFSTVMRVVVPTAEALGWTTDFQNADSLRGGGAPFDVHMFVQALTEKLTAFGRFNLQHVKLPSYDPSTGLDTYFDTVETMMLLEATQHNATVTREATEETSFGL